MAGFNLSRKNPTDKKRPDEFCLRMSDKLRKFVKSMNWFPVSRTPKKWSDEVRKLRNDLVKSISTSSIPVDVDADAGVEFVIEQTLDRYIKLRPTLSSLPNCKDWKQFRALWDWVTDVITKHNRDNPTLTISNEARSVAHVLSRLGWKGSAKDKLEQAVQVSMNNLADFINQLERFVLKSRQGEALDKIARKVYAKIELRQFVQTWFVDVHNRVNDWEAWNGNIMTEVFRPDSKHFHKWGKKVSTNWSGSSDLWFKLCERLKINVS